MARIRPHLFFDGFRYLFYFIDLLFGALMWGLAIDIRSYGGFTNKCVPLATYKDVLESPIILPVDSSPLCNAIIGVGVAATFFLLLAILWHTLIFVRRPFMPFMFEAVLFFILALAWLALSVSAFVKSTNLARNDISNLRVLIASGWVAVAGHLASALLAFIQHFATRKKRKDVTGKGATTTTATSGAARPPPPSTSAQPWQGIRTKLPTQGTTEGVETSGKPPSGGLPDTNRSPPNLQGRANAV